jgi:hypothetical protein
MPHRLTGLAALAYIALLTPLHAQAPPAPYPTPAPLAQYLIPDKAAEIALARTAAPPSISGAAEILTLTPDGYSTAVKGTNGFTCLVERSWGKDTSDPEFYNPRVRAPHCINTPAAKTYLPIVLLKTKLILASKSTAEIANAIQAAFDSHQLPALEPNAMCYMMSPQQYLSDDDKHWHPHIMWYVPGDAITTWGANLPAVPVLAGSVPQDHMTVFLLKVDKWSDGTPVMAH